MDPHGNISAWSALNNPITDQYTEESQVLVNSRLSDWNIRLSQEVPVKGHIAIGSHVLNFPFPRVSWYSASGYPDLSETSNQEPWWFLVTAQGIDIPQVWWSLRMPSFFVTLIPCDQEFSSSSSRNDFPSWNGCIACGNQTVTPWLWVQRQAENWGKWPAVRSRFRRLSWTSWHRQNTERRLLCSDCCMSREKI
jgi:hypothetical protein